MGIEDYSRFFSYTTKMLFLCRQKVLQEANIGSERGDTK
jgi:hypothetical protein